MPDEKIEFLIAHGAGDKSHSNAELLSHLTGTRDLLASWGARPEVCDAGLFHSVYGTEAFESTLALQQRDRVASLIGQEAEVLAYLFCGMIKPTFLLNLDRTDRLYFCDRFTGKWIFPEHRQFADLCDIFAANWLEQRPRFPAEFQNADRAHFEKMLAWLLPKAREAICDAYGLRCQLQG